MLKMLKIYAIIKVKQNLNGNVFKSGFSTH